MEKKLYEAFTLIEMLIVMGIIMILIGVGIVGTRYALDSANKIEHQNSVDTVHQAFIAYYADNREYPDDDSLEAMLLSGGDLFSYLDSEFDGGSDASYYYWIKDDESAYLICVSLGGVDDEEAKGFYCNGNGFGDEYSGISDDEIDSGSSEASTITGAGFSKSDWTDGDWSSN